MASNNTAALRKRAQIAKANRTMFLWIAICSALVGSALVVSYFLARQLVYNEKVLAEKQNTVSVLEANNEIIPDLEAAIRVLDANEALAAAKAREEDQAIQVILDALPADANSPALGASLQSRLLAGVEGITVETLQVDPVSGVESIDDASTVDAAPVVESEDSVGNVISFQFSVSGNQDALKAVLQHLERSIRLIDIRLLRIESQGESQLMTVQGQAYYEPARTIELTDKVVPQ